MRKKCLCTLSVPGCGFGDTALADDEQNINTEGDDDDDEDVTGLLEAVSSVAGLLVWHEAVVVVGLGDALSDVPEPQVIIGLVYDVSFT